MIRCNLDDWILTNVSAFRTAHPNKPVFIGESGLHHLPPNDPANSYTLAPNAAVGINQAIWAGAVSGAMTARMLWFEDGYDQFHIPDLCIYAQFGAYPECTDGDPSTVLTLYSLYANASAPVAAFLSGVDYSGFEPLTPVLSADLLGAALGDDSTILGWVRDVQTVGPDWLIRPLTAQTVTVTPPGQFPDWLVTFYDTSTGSLLHSVYTSRQQPNGEIVVALPNFSGSIAFQLHAAFPLG